MKPCPFCTQTRVRVDRLLRDGCKDGEPDAYAYYVFCPSCGCQGPWVKNPSGAERLWNMRDGGFSERANYIDPRLVVEDMLKAIRHDIGQLTPDALRDPHNEAIANRIRTFVASALRET